jgi:hypothetical protein
MAVSWVMSILVVWLFPSSLAIWNPLLAPIARSVVRRHLSAALWGCFLTGCVQDLLLASPRVGLLALSSLISGAFVFRVVRLFPLDGFQGTLLVALLAATQGIMDILLCFVLGFSDAYSFFTLFAWKRIVLATVCSTGWAFVLYLGTVIRRRFLWRPS